jgi:transcriptional regulator with XRE-family HTH domain
MPPRAKGDRLPEAIAFGEGVRKRREGRGWTLEQLAEAAGLNPLQVGHIERGASDVKLSTIVKLAHALGTTASELLRSIR